MAQWYVRLILVIISYAHAICLDLLDQSDWEASSDEEDEKPKPAVVAAPPKKKGNLKAKLAEKAAEKAARGDDDDDYDEDAVLDPREKARRDKERELNADLSNAADLLGAAALGGVFLIAPGFEDALIWFCRNKLEGAGLDNFCAATDEGGFH